MDKWKAIRSILIPVVIMVGGCGGQSGSSDGGSPGGGGTSGATTTAAVTVKLPTGVSLPTGAVLSGGLFDKVALSSTSTTVPVWNTGRQLVGLVDSSGNPVLMGFVGLGHTSLDAKSTAMALAYFAVGGYASPNQSQDALLECLDREPNVDVLASDIASDLKTSGNLSSPTAKFRSTLVTVNNALLGQLSPKSITINPSGSFKSGVQVQLGSGANAILANNTYRRRVKLYVDKEFSVDGFGTKTSDSGTIGQSELSPALGTVAGQDILGNLSGEPVQTSSGDIPLPALSKTQSAEIYKVVAAGAGISQGQTSTLTASESTDLQNFLADSFVKDFFFPIFNRMLASDSMLQTSTQTQQALYYTLLENQVDLDPASARQFVDSNFPNARTQMQSGDYRSANLSILSALNNPTQTAAMVQFYLHILSGANLPGLAPSASRAGFVLSWINHALVSPTGQSFIFPQYSAFDNSNRLESWEITQNNVVVKVLPAAPTVDINNPANLSITLNVTVPSGLTVPAGSSLVYSWSTVGKHGDLTLGTQSGTSFPATTSTSILYGAITGLNASTGTDVVTVEVGIKDGSGNITAVGTGVSTVTVLATADVTLTPTLQSIQPSATSSTITASTTNPVNFTNGNATVVWSCTNSFGQLQAPTGQTTQTSVNYVAGSTLGTDTITCSYYWHGTKLSSSTAQVKVEKQPTVEFGSVTYRTWSGTTAQGIEQAGDGAAFVIPILPGVKNYSVHCYNFFDPIVYGSQLNFSVGADGSGAINDLDPTGRALGTVGAQGVFYVGGPGGVGTGPGATGKAAADLAQIHQRLAGMIVQVTCNY